LVLAELGGDAAKRCGWIALRAADGGYVRLVVASVRRSVSMTAWTRETIAMLAACAIVATAAAAADPFVGTWKLNVEKSRFEGGTPPKSSVATITTAGDKRRRLVVHTVPASGPELTTESTAADDGKDYPMKGSPTVDTVSVIKINDRTLERRDKKNGQVVATLRAAVSADGKTMTVVQTGPRPQGGTYTNTLVYDRQPQR
jgi:hypothetical protein